MAPVNIKYIVSFSSQDDYHKASNLVSSSDGLKKWLSNKKDRSGKLELILHLEEPCQFAYIDIGAVWCANLEIRVGRSDWPQSTEYKSLVPTVILMTPIDCQLGRGTSSTQMFSKKNFSEQVLAEKWDRLQIICRQPFRKDVQFGLSFVRIKDVSKTTPGGKTRMTSEISSKETPKQDISSIQKHFFGTSIDKKTVSDNHSDMLKYRLMKMAGSADGVSCENEQTLSRTAQIVLKASKNNKSHSPYQERFPLSKRGLFSEQQAKKHDVPLDEEVKAFLPTLNMSMVDIDKVQVSDLRHKFERKKRRKLTKEEKKIFSELCQDYICDLFDKSDHKKDTDTGRTTSSQKLSNATTKCKAEVKKLVKVTPKSSNNCHVTESSVTVLPMSGSASNRIQSECMSSAHQKNSISVVRSSNVSTISPLPSSLLKSPQHNNSSKENSKENRHLRLSSTPLSLSDVKTGACNSAQGFDSTRKPQNVSLDASDPSRPENLSNPRNLSKIQTSCTSSVISERRATVVSEKTVISPVILQSSKENTSLLLPKNVEKPGDDTFLKNEAHTFAAKSPHLSLKRRNVQCKKSSQTYPSKFNPEWIKGHSTDESENETDDISDGESDETQSKDEDSLSTVSYYESESEEEHTISSKTQSATSNATAKRKEFAAKAVKDAYKNLYKSDMTDQESFCSESTSATNTTLTADPETEMLKLSQDNISANQNLATQDEEESSISTNAVISNQSAKPHATAKKNKDTTNLVEGSSENPHKPSSTNQETSYGETSGTTVTKISPKPVMGKMKLNQDSMKLIYDFCSELISSDEEMNNNTEKTETVNTLAEDKNNTKHQSSFNKDNFECAKNPSKPKSVLNNGTKTPTSSQHSFEDQTENNRTPKSAKGKVYRMYTSRKSMEKAKTEKDNLLTKASGSKESITHSKRSSLCTTSSPKSKANQAKALPELMNTRETKGRAGGRGKDAKTAPKRRRESEADVGNQSKRSRGRTQRSNDRIETERMQESSATSEVEDDTQFCEKCYELFPSDVFATHDAFCVPPSSQISSTGLTAVGEPIQICSRDEMLIDESVDYAECPICMQRFPMDVLPVHASECGI